MPLALDEDLERAMKGAMVMLAVMDFRCRLLGMYPGTVRGPRKEGKHETWLRTQELVKSAASDHELAGERVPDEANP
jgi:hypothetical protein